jgi:hypothetical protein
MTDNSAEKLEQLNRRLEALVLGGIDMGDVVETARYLLGDHAKAPGHDGGMPWRARRTLETGLFTTYARSFIESRGDGLPRLKKASNLSGELRECHEEILTKRNKVYAHTDRTPYREILEFASPEERAAWLREQGGLSERWFPPDRAMLKDVVALAEAQLKSFLAEIGEVKAILVELDSHTPLTSR